MILEMMDKAIERVREFGYNPVYIALYGSQNYGLDVYGDDYASDYDFKVIVMPSIHDVVFKSDKISTTIDYDGGLIDIKSAVDMTLLYGKMNQQYLETLVTPFYKIYEGGEYMEEIRASLQSLIDERSKLLVGSIVGHYQAKASKVFIPNGNGIPDYDPKNAYHMLRLLCMLEDFKKTGKLVLLPPVSDKDMLLAIKQHKLSPKEVYTLTGEWDQRLQNMRLQLDHTLRDPVDDTLTENINKTKIAWYYSLQASN